MAIVKYQHRQFGTTLVVTLGIGVVICLILANRLAGAYISFGIGLILVICAVLFSSLSIEITDRHLRWKFGPGLIRKQELLADMVEAKVTKTRFLEGWGIHLTSRGWLYNVSGFHAVAITMKTGKQFLLGSDEPERLVAVLREQFTDA